MKAVPERHAGVYVFAALVALACLLSYAIGLHGPLFFDDEPNLLANNLVQINGRESDGWRVAAVSSESGVFFRPLSMLSFALNHAASGAFTPFSLKAVNLAIHLLLGGLIYCFAVAVLSAPVLRVHTLTMEQRRVIALTAAALWLLHPLQVSTVLYAVQRMAQLATLFTLAGLLVFFRYRQRWAESGAGPGDVIAASLWLSILTVLAVLCKENGALLPWLLAVVEVTLFRGVWRGQERVGLVRLGWLVLLLPLAALALVFMFTPEWVTGRYWGREFTLQDRLLTQARTLWQYLSWLVVPNVMDMGFFHDDIAISRSWWSPATTVVSVVAWAAVLGAAVIWRRRYPLLAFAILFYLVGHSMESSVYPLEMVFEHRNYLPAAGVFILLAVGIYRLAARFDRLRLRFVLGGIMGVLVALLVVRTSAWSDELTLARYNVVNHPQSARANFFYANAIFKRFQQADALRLDEEERRALAVTARTYFERMHVIDKGAFSSLVMLYQLDSLYFPGLVQDNDWLGKIETVAASRRLQSSDRTALGGLVGFSLTPAGASGRERTVALVDELLERDPRSMDLLANKYRLLQAAGDERRALVLASLEEAARLNPGSRQAAAYLAQFHGTADLANTYEAIRAWLQRDRFRRELSVIKDIFDN